MTFKQHEAFINKALEQVQEDIKAQDLTAIEELLKSVPVENLYAFLSEEDMLDLMDAMGATVSALRDRALDPKFVT